MIISIYGAGFGVHVGKDVTGDGVIDNIASAASAVSGFLLDIVLDPDSIPEESEVAGMLAIRGVGRFSGGLTGISGIRMRNVPVNVQIIINKDKKTVQFRAWVIGSDLLVFDNPYGAIFFQVLDTPIK